MKPPLPPPFGDQSKQEPRPPTPIEQRIFVRGSVFDSAMLALGNSLLGAFVIILSVVGLLARFRS